MDLHAVTCAAFVRTALTVAGLWMRAGEFRQRLRLLVSTVHLVVRGRSGGRRRRQRGPPTSAAEGAVCCDSVKSFD